MNHKLWLSLVIGASGLLLAASSAAAPALVAAAGTAGESAVQPPALVAPPSAPQAPADTPYSLVASGVTSYTIADPKVFFYSLPACNNPPPPAPTTNTYETIRRIPTYGGQERKLYSHLINTGTDLCPNNVDVMSNVISDGSYLYWVSKVKAGLVKLSVSANNGDVPTVVNTVWAGQAEIVLANGTLYELTEPGPSALMAINLTNGSWSALVTPGTGSSDLQTDGEYVYWLRGGTLHQWYIAGGVELSTIASGVTGYHPTVATVYYGKGKTIHRFGNTSRADDLIYTSADSTAIVYSLGFDDSHLFWFEDHALICAFCLIPPHDDFLFRSGPNGGSPTQIYVFHGNANVRASDVRTDNQYLFWLENGVLQRMPEDASALPDINLVADSLEVTQGIQNTSNGVPLIQNRDTYARFYVHSSGAAVPGVTAYLYRTNSGGAILDGPVAATAPLLTVLPTPHRNNLNDSFLFQLPWNWLTGGTLYLRAVLNPNQYPLEPNYADNVVTFSATLQPSPQYSLYLIEWSYTLNGKGYAPTKTDEQLDLSWLRRAYPIDSILGGTSGFFPVIYQIYDAGLGSRVNQTSSECSSTLCASQYINTEEQTMRDVWPIPDTTSIYGLISDVAGPFPRGQECCGTRDASGPAGIDVDGYYGGHENGHTLGRSHPSSSALLCGNSASDPSYPYPNGQIGPSNGALEGFDVGDPSLGLPLQIYPGAKWTDVMTYCQNEWISDYTYNGMYAYLIANPPAAPARPGGALAAPALAGDWLQVNGEIVTTAAAGIQKHVSVLVPTTTGGILARVQHLSTIAQVPPRVAGPYSLELYDAGNSLLASYPFTPLPATGDHPDWLPFSQVVTYVANTAQLRLVQLAGNAILATKAIPPHAPAISNVHLVGAPNPVSGPVTLQWTAGDVDGNPLTFDIDYSPDGGTTLRPVQVGISGTSTLIDTGHLGGSQTALFRVVASDGVNTAHADSAIFSMANKLPEPAILSPADGAHRHWGQLVNFNGEATDAQDGFVNPANLAWSDQNGPLGTGALLSISDLPVGTNVISLTATDSANLQSTTRITVIVDDDMNLPGPTLSVGPQQFGWSFASSADAVQTDTLTLDNVGGGSLSWTATTDAPWLKLSLASGTAPASITLTASPSGLAANTGLTGHIFLNVPASGGSLAQQMVIPVGIGVGININNPPPPPMQLFLPLVNR